MDFLIRYEIKALIDALLEFPISKNDKSAKDPVKIEGIADLFFSISSNHDWTGTWGWTVNSKYYKVIPVELSEWFRKKRYVSWRTTSQRFCTRTTGQFKVICLCSNFDTTSAFLCLNTFIVFENQKVICSFFLSECSSVLSCVSTFSELFKIGLDF